MLGKQPFGVYFIMKVDVCRTKKRLRKLGGHTGWVQDFKRLLKEAFRIQSRFGSWTATMVSVRLISTRCPDLIQIA